MFCKKCGTEIRLNAKFCAKCGTPVPVPAPAEKKPAEDVKPILNRKEETRSDPAMSRTPEKKAEEPELVIHMDKTKSSSSNGQFHEWFSEPGDL